MQVSEKIMDVTFEDEFRICPSCSYERGFHTSFLRLKGKDKKYSIILICPNCGDRFNIGWEKT